MLGAACLETASPATANATQAPRLNAARIDTGSQPQGVWAALAPSSWKAWCISPSRPPQSEGPTTSPGFASRGSSGQNSRYPPGAVRSTRTLGFPRMTPSHRRKLRRTVSRDRPAPFFSLRSLFASSATRSRPSTARRSHSRAISAIDVPRRNSRTHQRSRNGRSLSRVSGSGGSRASGVLSASMRRSSSARSARRVFAR